MRRHLRTLVDALAIDHDVCVVALRWPGQAGVVEGVELHLLEPPDGGGWRGARDRAAAVLLGRPVDWRRQARPFRGSLPGLLAERSFDVAHIALDDLALVAPLLGRLPAVVAPLDARHLTIRAQRLDATGARRHWRAHQERAVRRALARDLRPFGAAVFVTDEDAEAVRRLDPALPTRVIPIAVDATVYAPPDEAPPREEELIVFTGTLDAPANVAAARRLATSVLPLVQDHVPGARLALVGRAPAAAVRALGGRPGVEVVADPDDLRPWLWRAGAFASPTAQASGMKNTLLEAMAAGAAAVASPAACRGLDVRDDVHLLLRRSDEDLAEGITAVLRDPRLRDRVGGAARRHVATHHAPRIMGARFAAVYSEAAGRGA
ncbi:MAG TPA: glycosyltransferase [Acidimicrobiales bacterium]|nr:glycosyltransferase [Acidimicrobiales bacterium]